MRISQKIVHLTSLISYCCKLNINAANNELDVCLFCVYDFKLVTQISLQNRLLATCSCALVVIVALAATHHHFVYHCYT